jgi:hypothetical protein
MVSGHVAIPVDEKVIMPRLAVPIVAGDFEEFRNGW